MLRNYLFGSVKLTKNADLNKYSYSGYGIPTDVRGNFSFPSSNGFCKNVLIFGTGMSSSVHIDNTKKVFWYFVKVKRKDYMTLHWLQKLNTLLTLSNKKKIFCLILSYNESNSYLFVNGVKI